MRSYGRRDGHRELHIQASLERGGEVMVESKHLQELLPIRQAN